MENISKAKENAVLALLFVFNILTLVLILSSWGGAKLIVSSILFFADLVVSADWVKRRTMKGAD